MYVTFEQFAKTPFAGMTADEYARAAQLADMLVDHWTLGRVGACRALGHELPAAVVTAYAAVAAAVPPALEESSAAGGRLVSYSDGVDSYGFAAAADAMSAVWERAGWAVEALPVEWLSAAVSYGGGCDA